MHVTKFFTARSTRSVDLIFVDVQLKSALFIGHVASIKFTNFFSATEYSIIPADALQTNKKLREKAAK